MNFSTTEDRASLFEDQVSDRELFFSPRQKKKTQHKSLKKERNKKSGQINFHIVGYQGTHNISVLDLVHYIPFSRLKAAAKKFLKHSGINKKRKRKSNKKKTLQHGQEKGFVNDDGAAVLLSTRGTRSEKAKSTTKCFGF
jgi:hypothetical protein